MKKPAQPPGGNDANLKLLFALAVIPLLALAWWWAFFIGRSIDLELQLGLDHLIAETQLTALQLGTNPDPPALGAVADEPDLEIVPATATAENELFAPLAPHWDQLSVRPKSTAVAKLYERHRTRRMMVFGEGTVLFALIATMLAIFLRYALRERALRAENDNFLSIITHELRTPVTGVKAVLQSLEMGRLSEERRAPVLKQGLHELDRLEHLIDNVLTRNRLRRAAGPLPVIATELRPALERLIAGRLSGAAGEPEKLEDGPNPVVLTDADALRVIVDNLLDNARKYGKQDAGARVRIVDAGAMARIEVADDGIGFAPELAERLFDPYFRAAEAGKGGARGAGLGLAIARSVARRMGGDLTAASAGAGRGATFTLTLKKAT